MSCVALLSVMQSLIGLRRLGITRQLYLRDHILVMEMNFVRPGGRKNTLGGTYMYMALRLTFIYNFF